MEYFHLIYYLPLMQFIPFGPKPGYSPSKKNICTKYVSKVPTNLPPMEVTAHGNPEKIMKNR